MEKNKNKVVEERNFLLKNGKLVDLDLPNLKTIDSVYIFPKNCKLKDINLPNLKFVGTKKEDKALKVIDEENELQ